MVIINSFTDKIKKILQLDNSRFHVPGHKGYFNKYMPSKNIAKYDITEIKDADSLYESDGIIYQLERSISRISGSGDTLISCSGSTLAIQTMLSVFAKPDTKVLMSRNSHVSALNCAALIGFEPVWVYPNQNSGFGLPGRINSEDIDVALQKYNNNISAVYITSPDYFGVISDIKSISEVCKKYNKPLLVDNAHGSHLFIFDNLHPIQLGADMCSDSWHKTFPTMTGSAVLHMNKAKYRHIAKSNMSIFGSTSPSYLMMMSMDSNRKYIQSGGQLDYIRLAQKVNYIRSLALKNGFLLPEGLQDPIRITLSAIKLGYNGAELAQWFRKNKIEPEYVGDYYVVLVPTPHNSTKDFNRLIYSINNIPLLQKKHQKIYAQDLFDRIYNITTEKKMSIRDAVISPSEIISVENSYGRVAAENKCSCPPGVPMVVAGDIINSDIQKLLLNYSISFIKVVK